MTLLGKKVEDGELAGVITDLFEESATARRSMELIWEKCYNNYRGIVDKNYPYKYFIPETATVIETVLPRLTGDFTNKVDGFLAIEGRNEAEEERAHRVKNMLNFVKDYAEFDKKFVSSWRDGLIYGTFWTLVYYEYEETDGDIMTFLNPYGEEEIMFDEKDNPVRERIVTKDTPNYKLLSPFEVYPDPRYKNMEEAEYFIHRHSSTYEDLKNNKGFNQKIVSQIRPEEGSYLMDNAQRQEINERPFTSDNNVVWNDQPLEVFDFYSKDRWVTVVERKYVVQDIPNPIKKGWLPIFGTKTLEKHGHFYGIGLAEQMIDLQSIMNKLANLRLTNIALQTNPVTLINTQSRIDMNRFKFEPGAKYNVFGDPKSALYSYGIPDLGAGASDMVNQFKNDIQNITGVNDFIRGMISQIAPKREQTATEVSEKVKQASTRFESLVMIVMDYIKTLFRRFLDMLQQNFQNPDFKVRVKENDVVKFETITYEDLQGSYDLKLSVDPLDTAGQIRKQNLQNYYQTTINPLFSQMGFIDYPALVADMAKENDLKKDYINPEFGQMNQLWQAYKSGMVQVVPVMGNLQGGEVNPAMGGNGNTGTGGEEGFTGMMQNQMMPSMNSI